MGFLSLSSLLSVALLRGAEAHGCVTNPSPRYLESAHYCPWCVGEHRPGSNPYGSVNRDERLSHPCGGTKRGDPTYPAGNWGSFKGIAGGFSTPTYQAGATFDSTVLLEADHGGDAQWHLCPHSEDETEECFRSNPISDWKDVHCFKDCNNQTPHAYDEESYTDAVTIPANTPSGSVTLRWYWVCKWTDEVFTSCIDAEIQGAGAAPEPAPAPAPAPGPEPAAPAPSSGGETEGGETTEQPAASTAAPCASQDAVGSGEAHGGGQGRRALRIELNNPGCGDLVASAYARGAAGWAVLLAVLGAMQ